MKVPITVHGAEKLKEEFNKDLRAEYGSYLDECVQNKLAYFDNERFILTEEGFFLSDAIIHSNKKHLE